MMSSFLFNDNGITTELSREISKILSQAQPQPPQPYGKSTSDNDVEQEDDLLQFDTPTRQAESTFLEGCFAEMKQQLEAVQMELQDMEQMESMKLEEKRREFNQQVQNDDVRHDSMSVRSITDSSYVASPLLLPSREKDSVQQSSVNTRPNTRPTRSLPMPSLVHGSVTETTKPAKETARSTIPISKKLSTLSSDLSKLQERISTLLLSQEADAPSTKMSDGIPENIKRYIDQKMLELEKKIDRRLGSSVSKSTSSLHVGKKKPSWK